jgi:hypothetical protein
VLLDVTAEKATAFLENASIQYLHIFLQPPHRLFEGCGVLPIVTPCLLYALTVWEYSSFAKTKSHARRGGEGSMA